MSFNQVLDTKAPERLRLRKKTVQVTSVTQIPFWPCRLLRSGDREKQQASYHTNKYDAVHGDRCTVKEKGQA